MAHLSIIRVMVCAVCLLVSACNQQSSQEVTHESSEADVSTDTTQAVQTKSAKRSRPNLLLIVADDLGYTDLGVYGGEIDTPNIDGLARDGLILTDFHNKAVCAPTRAALLSGTDNRNAGGAMHQTPNQKEVPGYESELNQDIVPLPQLLRDGGYNTYMAGKWHLGSEQHQLPIARGFTRSFSLMQGGASHYEDGRGMFHFQRVGKYVEDNDPVEKLPKGFYSSDFYTDYIIDAIDKDANSKKPWFAYLSFTAPHWPLHAPDEFVAKYKGKYDAGYDALRASRIANGKKLGVIPASAEAYPKLQSIADWDSLSEEQQKIAAREMEIYAAMVDSLDKNVGRLVQHLKDIGQYENTYIMFIADNGAEGADRDPGANGTDWTFDNSFENMGKVNSHIYYGAKWAQAGVGVGRYYKSYASEGGIRGPAIIHNSQLSKKGQISDAFASVVDVAPTFLELAGVEHAKINAKGEAAQPIQGVSMLPFTLGAAETVREDDFVFGWEVFGHRAIRRGDWKLLWLTSKPAERSQGIAEKADKWGLYNMANDPGEVNDLSQQHPEIVAELLKHWDDYVATNGIVLPVREKK